MQSKKSNEHATSRDPASSNQRLRMRKRALQLDRVSDRVTDISWLVLLLTLSIETLCTHVQSDARSVSRVIRRLSEKYLITIFRKDKESKCNSQYLTKPAPQGAYKTDEVSLYSIRIPDILEVACY